MMRLESIALRDCKVYRDWKNAPDGAILQIRTVSMRIPIIVLKCQIIGPQGNYLPCIVHLEGNQFAHWISLRDAGALDVSDHFEIHAVNPEPSPLTEEVGVLTVHDNGAFFMRVRQDQLVGYACLRASEKYQVGFIYYELNPENLIEVGKATLATPSPWSRQV